MNQLDFFPHLPHLPHLPRRLSHDEILAGFAELLRAVEAMEFWEPWPRKPPPQNKIKKGLTQGRSPLDSTP